MKIKITCSSIILSACLISFFFSIGCSPPKDSVLEAFQLSHEFSIADSKVVSVRAQKQYENIRALLDKGYLEEAELISRRMVDWRKGRALADVASIRAQKSYIAEARALIEEADEIRRNTRRNSDQALIYGQMALAHGYLGDLESLEVTTVDHQYPSGFWESEIKTFTGLALARFQREGFDACLRTLTERYDPSNGELYHLGRVNWLPAAYLILLDYPQIRENESYVNLIIKEMDIAMERLSLSYRAIHDIPYAEVLVELGRLNKAKEMLNQSWITMDPSANIAVAYQRSTLIAKYAYGWALVGDFEKLDLAIVQAEVAFEDPEYFLTKKPLVRIELAEALAIAGLESRAKAMYLKVLAETEVIKNPLPRCLSAAELSTSLGKTGFGLFPEIREPIEELLLSPWEVIHSPEKNEGKSQNEQADNVKTKI